MGLIDKVKKAANDAVNKNDEGSQEAIAAHSKKIEDVLEILMISPTFEVPSEIFLPEDLKTVEFNIQVPHGYDEGQVIRFVSQARQSIKFLTDLLKKRNEDVAKLASVIDKLQVDANNLRFENEIANGVSVMPTSGEGLLEEKLMEAKLRIRNLEDQVKVSNSNASSAQNKKGNSGVDKNAYEAVLDELSITKNRNSSLEEAVFALKSRLAFLEDDKDDELDESVLRNAPLSKGEYKKLDIALPTENEGELPVIENNDTGRSIRNSLPEPPENDGGRSLSVFDYSDEDDDSLEELMKNLKD